MGREQSWWKLCVSSSSSWEAGGEWDRGGIAHTLQVKAGPPTHSFSLKQGPRQNGSLGPLGSTVLPPPECGADLDPVALARCQQPTSAWGCSCFCFALCILGLKLAAEGQGSTPTLYSQLCLGLKLQRAQRQRGTSHAPPGGGRHPPRCVTPAWRELRERARRDVKSRSDFQQEEGEKRQIHRH